MHKMPLYQTQVFPICLVKSCLYGTGITDLVGSDHVLAVLADLLRLLFGLDQLGRGLSQFVFSFLHTCQQKHTVL